MNIIFIETLQLNCYAVPELPPSRNPLHNCILNQSVIMTISLFLKNVDPSTIGSRAGRGAWYKLSLFFYNSPLNFVLCVTQINKCCQTLCMLHKNKPCQPFYVIRQRFVCFRIFKVVCNHYFRDYFFFRLKIFVQQ